MTQWVTFAGVTAIVLVLVLVLTRLTADGLGLGTGEEPSIGDYRPDAAERVTKSHPGQDLDVDSSTSPRESADHEESGEPTVRPPGHRSAATSTDGDIDSGTGADSSEFSVHGPDSSTVPADPPSHRRSPIENLSTIALLANVTLSQGLFAGVLIGAVVYTDVPLEALGIAFDSEYLLTGITVGILAGTALYVGNELGAAIATHFGLEHDEGLRGLLAPDSAGGWAVLLGVVLPIVALFEELLFRAALIGALSAGFDIPLWILAVGSSGAFALGHGAQGRTGIVVTGLLGLVLAWLFITTGSLLVVVVAHYLINALEFLVHEWLGLEWTEVIAN